MTDSNNNNNTTIRKETHYFTMKDGSEDGLDVEETRYYSGACYDDNWNLKGYTSELKDKKTGKTFAFVDFYEGEDEGRIRYCPHCEEFGFQHRLSFRTYSKGEKRAEDHDNWLQCHECWTVVPKYETFAETEIKDSEQTVKEPSENESVFMSSKKRKYKDRRLNKYLDDDPDVAAEQKRYGCDNVTIIQ